MLHNQAALDNAYAHQPSKMGGSESGKDARRLTNNWFHLETEAERRKEKREVKIFPNCISLH